jgi:hypothetical protein
MWLLMQRGTWILKIMASTNTYVGYELVNPARQGLGKVQPGLATPNIPNKPNKLWEVHQRGLKSVSDLFSHLAQNDTLIVSTLKLVNGPEFV